MCIFQNYLLPINDVNTETCVYCVVKLFGESHNNFSGWAMGKVTQRQQNLRVSVSSRANTKQRKNIRFEQTFNSNNCSRDATVPSNRFMLRHRRSPTVQWNYGRLSNCFSNKTHLDQLPYFRIHDCRIVISSCLLMGNRYRTRFYDMQTFPSDLAGKNLSIHLLAYKVQWSLLSTGPRIKPVAAVVPP